MKYLLSPESKKVLEALSFTKTLYAFDFDGTLCPIVSSPTQAKMNEQTTSLLRALSSRASVAVISGRSIADLKSRLTFVPDHLIGNHGLEGLPSRSASTEKTRGICMQWSQQLEKFWGKQKSDPGIFLEDKTYSLALHYRKSRNKKQVRAQLFELIDSLDPGPRVILGKCVVNLVPVGASHKGVALLELMLSMNSKSALYIGDDDTDEDVFCLPDSRIITVRIARKRTSHAQYYLERQSQINQLLREILKYFEKGESKWA